MTVEQWLSDWLTLRTPGLKPRTLESYSSLIRRYVNPSIGNLQLEQLTPIHITHMLASITATGHT